VQVELKKFVSGSYWALKSGKSVGTIRQRDKGGLGLTVGVGRVGEAEKQMVVGIFSRGVPLGKSLIATTLRPLAGSSASREMSA